MPAFSTFEGGAIVCHDAATKSKIDTLKNFGITDETTVNICGINGKMSEIHAAFGLLKLQNIDASIHKNKIIDKTYRQQLATVNGIHCLNAVSEGNFSFFPILVKPEYPLSRDELYLLLHKEGIYARRYFYPLISNLDPYNQMPHLSRTKLEFAQNAAKQIICLPIYPDLDTQIVNQITTLIRRI